METKTYASLFALIEALCGVQFSPVEAPRIKALINRRATMAYDESEYWPRFLRFGEEREVSGGVIPFTQGNIQAGLEQISVFLRIYRTNPATESAQEFSFSVGPGGASLIAGSLDPSSAFVTYKAVHDTEYGDSGSESTTVPKEWFQYIAHGTYADFLRSEGQQEKSAMADMEAREFLTNELIKIQPTINLVANKVSTNLSMQAR